MNAVRKSIALLLAILLIGTSFSLSVFADDGGTDFSPSDKLTVSGEKIVNGRGEEVILRGTNFGGWGIMEDWFCPFTDPAGEENMYQTLVSRFGTEKTHALFKTYRSNWITETDYRNVAAMGMNCVRLPVWYRNFQSDDNGAWYRTADGEIDFSELDGVVEMCRRYGLYLILDLHGLPGFQNDYDHCGKSKSMSLFDDTPEGRRCREVTLDFWTEVARHLAGDPVIAMYDLMNEPLGTNITREGSLQQRFWDFSDELYRGIRAVDPDTVITMEAIWDPWAIPSPDVYGWQNVVYQEHLYDVSNPAFLGKLDEIRRADYGAPFLIGEFYPRGVASFDYLFSAFNARGLSWTTWTYKGAGPQADSSPWFLYGAGGIEKADYRNDSYETLLEKWGEVLRTDSGAFSRTAFADYAALFTDGSVDRAALYTFGAIDSIGSLSLRLLMLRQKITAIKTTILDWLRKLRTGDLL